MQGIELIVALLLASTVLAGVARAIHVHYAIVLVLGGLAVGLVSGTSAPQVDPHTVLFVFLPPLIYAASFSSSTQDLRAHARAIGLLAVGLVLLSMTAVAAVAHTVAGIGWGPALVLGAILGPTDPIAATSVLRRLGAPNRISTILEGEALINDGTGLTVYKLAVAAVVSGHFSPGAGIVKFIAVAAGGVAVGLAAGWVSVEIRKRIDEPQIEISISLLTAYLAYIPADRIGASGVLAAVAAGLYTGGRAGSMLSPTSRLRTLGFWEALTFLLESVLFLLIGLELPHITRGLSVERPLLYSAAVLVTLIAVRMAWMFTVPLVAQLVRPSSPRTSQQSRHAEQIVLGWSAMRGGVSLAAALALPLTAAGRPFPDRANVIFISYIAIAATLVIPGLTLAPLVRRLGLGEDEAVAREEARARVQLAHAALKHIDDLAEHEQLAEPVVDQLRTTYELRIHRLEPHADGNAGPRRRGRGRPPDTRAAQGADRRGAPPTRRPPPSKPDLSPIPSADRTRARPRGIPTNPMTSSSGQWSRREPRARRARCSGPIRPPRQYRPDGPVSQPRLQGRHGRRFAARFARRRRAALDCRSAPTRWQSSSAHADVVGRGSKARTGARVELGAYSVRHGDRVVYGQRVDGVVRVTDVPLPTAVLPIRLSAGWRRRTPMRTPCCRR